MAMVASNMSGHLQSQLTRSLERIFEEACLSGELRLIGRKLKDFPHVKAKYDLSDTVHADLSKNRFGELPAEVTEFCSLEKLVLYYNTIKSIPDSVVYLQSLLYLDLSRNQLTVLPSSLCQLPLEILLVANNKLVSLPDELGRMKTLTELDVSCNEIVHLPYQIGELSSLRSLNLRRNKLIDLSIGLTHLNLERLNLSENRISTLPVQLRKMTTLVELNLNHNPLVSPPAYLCTRGRVHIFKYLEIQAMKGDKRKGLLTDDFKKVQRKTGLLSDLHLSNGIASDSKQKRYNVDSGYCTSEGSDKRWSEEIKGILGDEACKLKSQWVRSESLPIPANMEINGSCSGSSTPSTISPGDNINLETEFEKQFAALEMKDKRITDLLHSEREESLIISAKESTKATNGSTNKAVTNGSSISPSNDGMVNGNGLHLNQDDKRPLEHIQTYREYKEALKQQRAQESSSVYRSRIPTESSQQNSNHVNNVEEVNCKNNSVCSQPDISKSQKIFEETSNKRPVQKVPPSRNGSAVTFQDARVVQVTPLVNGSRTDCLNKNSISESPESCYIKPSSPTKTTPGSPRLVTASLGYVNTVVPVSSNQHSRSASTGSSPRSPKIGGGRNIPWNRDVPPEKLSFTMRREFDKAREEAELIEQLRIHIESRLKMALPEDMASALSDGVVLCHLANHVKPRSVASIHVPSPAVPKLTMARCRRNVDNFLEACRRIGVEEAMICCASDVLESRGLVQIAVTVSELLRFHQPRSPGHVTT